MALGGLKWCRAFGNAWGCGFAGSAVKRVALIFLEKAPKVFYLLHSLCPPAAQDIARHLRDSRDKQDTSTCVIRSSERVIKELNRQHDLSWPLSPG